MSHQAGPGGAPGQPLEIVAAGAGRLVHAGARFLLIRPETLAGVQRALDAALGPAAAADVLLAGGRAGGASALAGRARDPRERVASLLRMGEQIGWGQFALERLTDRELVVSVGDSPFAEAHGPAAAPVCHLTRGVLHALAESVFGRPAAVREAACAAAGAKRCRFEASPA